MTKICPFFTVAMVTRQPLLIRTTCTLIGRTCDWAIVPTVVFLDFKTFQSFWSWFQYKLNWKWSLKIHFFMEIDTIRWFYCTVICLFFFLLKWYCWWTSTIFSKPLLFSFKLNFWKLRVYLFAPVQEKSNMILNKSTCIRVKNKLTMSLFFDSRDHHCPAV